MKALLGIAAVLVAAQQVIDVRLYRMMQVGAEVGRETYRAANGTLERSVVIPVLDLRIDSRAAYDRAGRFLRFEAKIMNAAGDTTRGQYALESLGDSLVATRVRGDSTLRRTLKTRRADGVAPAQSISLIAEAVERAGGRDTVFRFVPMGADTTVEIVVRHAGDTAFVTTAGVPAFVLRSAGPRATIEVPAQRLTAAVWNGRDSLPALTGLRRPTPDYRAPAGAPYTAEEVSIPVHTEAGEDFTLAGTLTLPQGTGRPVPVVVTISGSGRQPRNEDLWPLLPDYRPFAEIADRLGRAGLGVLRYDDRGTGGSGGGNTEATTGDYAKEVGQIVAWLRQRPGVDAARIALLGHSEGGAIGPLVAADDPRIAAVVMMAGPGKTGRAIITDQFRWPIELARGLPGDERARLLGNLGREVEGWAGMNKWTRWFADYDPLPTARRLRQPVLILQGALDRQVSAGQADTLAAAIKGAGNRDVTVRVYPRLNHLFLVTDGDGMPSEYPGLRVRALPAEVLDMITNWLTARLRTR
jgi:dienelactone hydrolase